MFNLSDGSLPLAGTVVGYNLFTLRGKELLLIINWLLNHGLSVTESVCLQSVLTHLQNQCEKNLC